MQKLTNLFTKNFGEKVEAITLLPQSGSYRKYYRIISENHSVIGTYNEDRRENNAFISFSEHFINRNLPVPRILAKALDKDIYLQEDLGDTTLFDWRGKQSDIVPIKNMYSKVLSELARFQTLGGDNLDYTNSYPREKFDKQSIMWDLNYFKYCMLKIVKIPFDEQKLEDDFNNLSDFLLTANTNYFLYRDFQSRNIMLNKSKPIFIDYQGGRKGALHYDVASLLYDAKANIPQNIREELVEVYITEIQKHIKISRSEFHEHYPAYILIRILQALGAYGFRGLIEKKLHFIQSIPFALSNLKYILENKNLNVELPELKKVLYMLVNKKELHTNSQKENKLQVLIKSFSYIYGEIPKDETEFGGGFVFDCRILPNPGRQEKYRSLTGMDKPVIQFLEAETEVENFMSNTYLIVKQAIDKYIERDFTYLSFNFGCTGGQHRSVYCAEKIKKLINDNYNVNVVLKHVQQNK